MDVSEGSELAVHRRRADVVVVYFFIRDCLKCNDLTDVLISACGPTLVLPPCFSYLSSSNVRPILLHYLRPLYSYRIALQVFALSALLTFFHAHTRTLDWSHSVIVPALLFRYNYHTLVPINSTIAWKYASVILSE
jgi:hypothetical protein